jgi:predicted aldo/keto reductase-like oxidoreductase
VPIVSMGVMNSNNPEVVAASYELGVRHFDTAASYAYGRNEQMVGEVIKRLGVRDKVLIATKVFGGGQRAGLTGKEAADKLVSLTEGSLVRLKTDHVDILYIHSVSNPDELANEGWLDGIRRLKEQGKIRAVGVSTHQNMAGVINKLVEVGAYDVVLTSFNATMASDTDLLAAIKGAAEKGVGVVAMKTQAGGQRMPNPETRQQYASSTVNTALLKWVLRNENIRTSIPGYDNFEHMKEDFSVASNLEYTEDEAGFLSDNSIELSLGFCRQCKGCLASCPRNTDIPTLMRTHMYAAQYANFHHARQTLDEISVGRGLTECASCSECTAKCVNAVDIPRRISELKAMYV